MLQLTRVVWTEGMHLAQHHFQLQTRYFEDLLRFASATLAHRPYGFTRLQLDAAALVNGTVVLAEAVGLLPDGLPIDVPGGDPAPAPLALGDAAALPVEGLAIGLVAPPQRRGAANVAADPAAGTRWLREERTVYDQVTGRDVVPVTIGRKNLRLAVLGDAVEGSVLPVARVRRDRSGTLRYDAEFVPPCLHFGASPVLADLLAALVGTLGVKAQQLAAERPAHRPLSGRYAPRDVANFWFLHALNTGLTALRHVAQTPTLHPADAFAELSRLAGALCTFGLEVRAGDLPLYDHDAPGPAFRLLDQHIRRHLDLMAPETCVTVPLARLKPYLWSGTVTDPRCFDRARWILGVRAPLSRAELIERVPRSVVACSAKHIEAIIQRALPGLAIEHLAEPPASVSPRADVEYFSLAPTGMCWESIQRYHEVGFYVNDAIPDAELDFLIALES